MPDQETASERIFFGFIKLTDRQQLIGFFVLGYLFLGWINYKNSEEIRIMHNNEVDRLNNVNIIVIKENIDLKKELIRSYDYKHDAVQQKLNKVDSIIQYHKK